MSRPTSTGPCANWPMERARWRERESRSRRGRQGVSVAPGAVRHADTAQPDLQALPPIGDDPQAVADLIAVTVTPFLSISNDPDVPLMN